MRVFYAIGLLLLINGQVNSLPTKLDGEDEHSKSEGWLNKNVEDLINEVTESSALIADDQLNIEKSTIDAFHDLHIWQELIDSDCYQQGLQQLQILRKASVSEFFHCDRLKKGLEDIGLMFKGTFNITYNVVKHVGLCLAKCAFGKKVAAPACVTTCILDFTNDVKSLIPGFKAYAQDMKRLAAEIKEIYEYCANPKDHKVNQQVAAILEGTKLCTMNQQNFKNVY